MTIDGTYEVNIKAPTGPQPMTIELRTSGDELQGWVSEGTQTLDLLEPTFTGNTVSFKLKVTTPMPLTLSCEATIEGDTITGTAAVSMMKLPFEGTRV